MGVAESQDEARREALWPGRYLTGDELVIRRGSPADIGSRSPLVRLRQLGRRWRHLRRGHQWALALVATGVVSAPFSFVSDHVANNVGGIVLLVIGGLVLLSREPASERTSPAPAELVELMTRSHP